jgi:hypothetical protein
MDAQHAEELVDLLMQAARRGEWRVVGLMLDRVFGRPKETMAVEHDEPEELTAMRQMTPEARRILLRQMNEAEAAAAAEAEDSEAATG